MANERNNDSPKTTKGLRILLVDDDRFLLEFFTRVLTAQGYTTVQASNGAEAEAILNTDTDTFDLMVVDLLMPVQSGWKLIDKLKKHEDHKKVPIIALTGMSLSFEEYDRIRSMADAVLLKGDFEISRFNNTINEVLENRTL
jgi:DNA-binding response OmpR family regulator